MTDDGFIWDEKGFSRERVSDLMFLHRHRALPWDYAMSLENHELQTAVMALIEQLTGNEYGN